MTNTQHRGLIEDDTQGCSMSSSARRSIKKKGVIYILNCHKQYRNCLEAPLPKILSRYTEYEDQISKSVKQQTKQR